MGLKVAVIGLSPSQADAQWGDTSWEKWGLPWSAYWEGMDRHFEMHDLSLLNDVRCKRKPDYFDQLAQCNVLYMQEDFRNAKRYPFEDVATTTGYYWNSSIAYIMAMAIHEGADEIGIWGVDMKDSEEYSYQRPNMEYLIGLAMGRGIKVTIHESSPLCKFNTEGIKFYDFEPHYILRYGHVSS